MDEVRDEQQAIEWERLATNLRVELALLPILELLHDLPVIVFKGGVLTRLIYGDLRSRASGDNDLWIREPHCSVALSRLLKAGYQPSPGLDPRAALRRYGQVALWPDGDLDEVSVDLHAEPFMGSLFRIDEAVLHEHLHKVSFHEREVTTFDRPLSFVHMVAHYLQHRLERHHLREIGAAWDGWMLDEIPLRELARSTCSEEALEHALWLAGELGFARRPVPARRKSRALLIGRLDSPTRPSPRPNRGRFYSLVLASPLTLPRAAFDAIFLDSDDLISRFGGGSRRRQILRRAHQLLTRK